MAPAAPKKKAGGAAAKGSDAPHSDKELLQRAEAEALSLRRQLEQKHAEAVQARVLERGWRQRAEAAERALQQAHEDMADIKADIARQHVMSQEQLSQRVAQLETQLLAAQAAADAAHASAAQRDMQLAQVLQDKERQAAAHEHDRERLHSQFAAMLKEALSSLRAQLEAEATSVVVEQQRGC